MFGDVRDASRFVLMGTLWAHHRGTVDGSASSCCMANPEHNAKLHERYLRGANLSASDLESANLQQADLGGAHLREADLSGAHFSGAILEKTSFRYSLEESNWVGSAIHFGPKFARFTPQMLVAARTPGDATGRGPPTLSQPRREILELLYCLVFSHFFGRRMTPRNQEIWFLC